jgi:hypothetical protein
MKAYQHITNPYAPFGQPGAIDQHAIRLYGHHIIKPNGDPALANR